MIVAHNALLGGRVANAESRGDDNDVRAVRDLNARIAVDPRVTSISFRRTTASWSRPSGVVRLRRWPSSVRG